MIRLLIVGVLLGLYLVVVGPPLILHALLTGSVDRLYRAGVGGVTFVMRLAGVRIEVKGLENIPPGVCIFAANHTSAADAPAVISAIPRRISVIVKKELFRIPILGRAMRLAQWVPVDRSDREAAIGSVEEAIRQLRAGASFLVYPEGTRSLDGRLRPFKKGTFVMAIRAGVSVVPVSVAGAEKIIRKGELAARPGVVRVRFHPPIDAAQYTLERKEELLERVHAAVASGLPEELRPLRPAVLPAAEGS